MIEDNNDLRVFLLEWLYERMHNKLISKSMLPKLTAFKSFNKTDVLFEIDSLHRMGYVNLNKITDGPGGIELISIARSGVSFLYQLHHA